MSIPKRYKTVEERKEINRIRHERWYDEHIDELKEYYADRWKQGKTSKQRIAKLKTESLMENTSVSIIQMDILPEINPQKKKKLKNTLLVRKNAKIEADLAKIDAKAAAFREKLAAGFVVQIEEHNFSAY